MFERKIIIKHVSPKDQLLCGACGGDAIYRMERGNWCCFSCRECQRELYEDLLEMNFGPPLQM